MTIRVLKTFNLGRMIIPPRCSRVCRGWSVFPGSLSPMAGCRHPTGDSRIPWPAPLQPPLLPTRRFVLKATKILTMPSLTSPETPRYVPAAETQADCMSLITILAISLADLPIAVDYADLAIIDLAKAGTPEGRAELTVEVCDAMKNQGFFYAINHGYTPSQVTTIITSMQTVRFTSMLDSKNFRYSGNPFFPREPGGERAIRRENEGNWFIPRLQTSSILGQCSTVGTIHQC